MGTGGRELDQAGVACLGFDVYRYYRGLFYRRHPFPYWVDDTLGLRGRGVRAPSPVTWWLCWHWIRGRSTHCRGTRAFIRADDAAGPLRARHQRRSSPSPTGASTLRWPTTRSRSSTTWPATVSEAGRVLHRGGHLCICVGAPGDRSRPLRGRRRVPFTLKMPRYFDGTVRCRRHGATRAGLSDGNSSAWTYTLEQYALALEQAGFRIEAMREPRPIDARRQLRAVAGGSAVPVPCGRSGPRRALAPRRPRRRRTHPRRYCAGAPSATDMRASSASSRAAMHRWTWSGAEVSIHHVDGGICRTAYRHSPDPVVLPVPGAWTSCRDGDLVTLRQVTAQSGSVTANGTLAVRLGLRRADDTAPDGPTRGQMPSPPTLMRSATPRGNAGPTPWWRGNGVRGADARRYQASRLTDADGVGTSRVSVGRREVRCRDQAVLNRGRVRPGRPAPVRRSAGFVVDLDGFDLIGGPKPSTRP